MGAKNRDRLLPGRETLSLADMLRLDGALVAFCVAPGCMNGRVLAIADLATRFGGACLVKDLEPRLVCRLCGGRGARIDAKV
jgi:hypothetical protein